MKINLAKIITGTFFILLSLAISKIILINNIDIITSIAGYVFSFVLSLFIILIILNYIQIKHQKDLFNNINKTNKLANKRMFYIYLKWLEKYKKSYEILNIKIPKSYNKEYLYEILKSIDNNTKYISYIYNNCLVIAIKKDLNLLNQLKKDSKLSIKRQLHLS